MMHEVTVKALLVDPVAKVPVVILKQTEGVRLLPIWLGPFEANAIAVRLENLTAPRPMTHDLLMSLVAQGGSRVARVIVCDLRDSTFFAEIVLLRDGAEAVIDARPSDAIALALRAGAPIFVSDAVFDKAALAPEDDDERQRKLHALLDSLAAPEPGELN